MHMGVGVTCWGPTARGRGCALEAAPARAAWPRLSRAAPRTYTCADQQVFKNVVFKMDIISQNVFSY